MTDKVNTQIKETAIYTAGGWAVIIMLALMPAL